MFVYKYKYQIAIGVVFLIWMIYCIISSHMINFGKIQWYFMGGNNSVLISSRGAVLVGPGIIDIWTSYPYIIGMSEETTETNNFIINIKNMTVEKFHNDNDFCFELINLKVEWPKPSFTSPYVGFLDLKGSGRSQEKWNRIMDGLKPKQYTVDQ